MQRIFVGFLWVLSKPAVLKTADAAVDFIYYAQFQVHTSKLLEAMANSLKVFHENKDIFIEQELESISDTEDPLDGSYKLRP